MIRDAWPAVLALVLAGCASGPGGRAPPPEAQGPRLFISPAGEPFRPGPDRGDTLGAWFARADADHDGRIVRDELIADSLRFFATLDVDGDGRIDGFENGRYERDVAPEITGEAGERPPDPGGPARRGGFDRGALRGAAAYGLTGEPQPVRAADRDLSQSVSRDEFEAHARRHMTTLDTDHDGALALAELTAQLRVIAVDERRRDRRAGGGRRSPPR